MVADGVAVIVGGGSGIGAALAARLAREARRLVIVDIDPDRAVKVAKSVGAGSESVHAEACDAGDAQAVESLADRIVDKHGPLRLWVNAAGSGHWGEALGAPEEVWRRLVVENYWPVVWPTLAACRRMHEQSPLADGSRGTIVNIASASAVIATPSTTPYTAAKHAVAGFTLALREEMAPLGVRVSLACPGPVATPFHDRLLVTGGDPSTPATAGRRPPAGCITPEAAADAVLDAARRNARVAVFPASLRRQWRLANWFPALLRGPMQRIVANMRRDQPGDEPAND